MRMQRVLQIVFIAGMIGFIGIVSFLSFSPPPGTMRTSPMAVPVHAAYPLSLLIGLGAALCCMIVSGVFLGRGTAGSGAGSSAPEIGDQDAIDETLRQIDDLTTSAGGSVPSEEALRRARAYIADIALLLPQDGVPWWVPEVSTGQGGSVVFLWQQDGSGLSLSFRDTGLAAGTRSAEWMLDPASSSPDKFMSAATHTLGRGIATPSEFVNSVWGRWSSGQAPLTD
jgi:hypothetical protein